MIFLYIAIAWIALLVLFVLFWARFAGHRRRLSANIEEDRQQSRVLPDADRRGAVQRHRSEDPGDVA